MHVSGKLFKLMGAVHAEPEVQPLGHQLIARMLSP